MILLYFLTCSHFLLKNFVLDMLKEPSVVAALIGVVGSLIVGGMAYLGVRNTINSHYKLQEETLKANSDDQRERLVAEQVSKSRIDWLKVTRKYISDYLSEVNQCWDLNEQWLKTGDDLHRLGRKIVNLSSEERTNDKELQDKIKEATNNKRELEKRIIDMKKLAESDYYKAVFSINPKEKIFYFLEQYLNLSKSGRVTATEDQKNDLMEAVGSEIQEFFKAEWENAKKEVLNGSIQSTENDIDETEQLHKAIVAINTRKNVGTSLSEIKIVFGDKSNEYKFIKALNGMQELIAEDEDKKNSQQSAD